MRAASTLLLLAAVGCRGPAPTLSPPPTPPAALPPLGDIIRTCAFEVSCLQSPPTATLGNCIDYFLSGIDNWVAPPVFFRLSIAPSEFRRYVDCAVASSDCAGLLRCASRGHDPSFCAAHPGNVCDGDLLVQCPPASAVPDWAIYTNDCAAAGLRCEAANGSASCTDGVGCDPSVAAYCDGNRYWVTCDGTTHLRSRVDCARDSIPGATCRIGSGFGDPAGCLPSGPPCSGARCDGDELVVCVAGEEVRADCTQLASRCDASSGKPACVPTASECGDGAKDQCAGGDLTTCVEGMLRAVDCATIGLSACTLPPVGSDPICG
ncbi:MAG TPA: hypothetical protein VF334_08230 [Polyangia bacterium]